MPLPWSQLARDLLELLLGAMVDVPCRLDFFTYVFWRLVR